jgi:hypothetical protein
VAIRDDLERILDPENFGLPDVARQIVAGRESVAGETSDTLPDLGIEEVIATLCDFVIAFRLALLELADEVERLQKAH